MANEAQYAEMWAQDAATMYGYAANSATAATMKPFTSPPQTTNPAGQTGQAAAVAQAARTPAGTSTQTLSQLTSALPKSLQSLASGGPSALATSAAAADPPSIGTVLSNAGDAFTFLSGLAFIASGVLFIIPPTISLATSNSTKSSCGSGSGGPAAGGSGSSGNGAAGPASASAATQRPTVTGSPASESASVGRAVPIGRLSAPPTWAETAPALRAAARALPGAGPVGSQDSGGEGVGVWPGAMGPAGLTAAAAGGGGAAGSGWAAQRAGAAQRQGGALLPYGNRPTVLPAVAHEASPREGTAAQAAPAAQAGDGPPSESLRDEINSLRKQIADMAMERDVLMRSAAMWAQQAAERADT